MTRLSRQLGDGCVVSPQPQSYTRKRHASKSVTAQSHVVSMSNFLKPANAQPDVASPLRLTSMSSAMSPRLLRDFVRTHARRLLLGDDARSLRATLRDELRRPPRVLLRDKVLYTLGVLNLVLTEAIVLAAPQHFHMWYTAWIVPLMAWRQVTFRRKKWMFMCDLCYWVNWLCLVHLYIFPSSAAVFEVAFALSCGPLAWAIVAWRNSLVFHDLEKMTSIFIHAAPPLLMYCQRWGRLAMTAALPQTAVLDTSGEAAFLQCRTLVGSAGATDWSAAADKFLYKLSGDTALACGGSSAASLFLPLLFYIIWQIGSTSREETCARGKLNADPEILTSLRWMARSGRGLMHDAILRVMRAAGWMHSSEAFDRACIECLSNYSTAVCLVDRTIVDPRFVLRSVQHCVHRTLCVTSAAAKAKTKAAFIVAQATYTLITLIPTAIIYRSHATHITFIAIWLIAATWNGATFYIEVFSRTYRRSLEDALIITSAAAAQASSAAPSAPRHHRHLATNSSTTGRSSDTLLVTGHADEAEHLDSHMPPPLYSPGSSPRVGRSSSTRKRVTTARES